MQDANTNDNCNFPPIFSFHEQSTSARYIQIPRLDTIKWWKVRHAWVGRVIFFSRNQSRRFVFDCPMKSSEIERSIAFDWPVCNVQSASLQFCSLRSASRQSASLQSSSLQSACVTHRQISCLKFPLGQRQPSVSCLRGYQSNMAPGTVKRAIVFTTVAFVP